MVRTTRATGTSRRTAWATALAVGLILLAGAVATATNVGILGFTGPEHAVGRASAADRLATPTTTGVEVQYQDVYVRDAAATVAAPTAETATPARGQEDGADEHHEHEGGEHERGDDDD